MIIISQKIKEYRTANGIKQRELADALGISAQALSKWERGECCPDISTLPILARLLGCRVDDFFE